jgi:hypothetical protein
MKRKRASTGAKKRVYKRRSPYTPYGTPYYKKSSYLMYKSPRTIMPQEYTTTLMFTQLGFMGAIAGFGSQLKYRDDMYDIDPLVGGTAMPGFTELAAIYARYRPLKCTMVVEFSNLETFPQSVQLLFSNSSAVTTVPQDFGNPHCRQVMLSGIAGGMSTRKLQHSVTKVALAGSQQPLFDDLYTGSTASATLASAAYCNMYISYFSTIAGTLAHAMEYRLTIEIEATFYRQFTFSA